MLNRRIDEQKKVKKVETPKGGVIQKKRSLNVLLPSRVYACPYTFLPSFCSFNPSFFELLQKSGKERRGSISLQTFRHLFSFYQVSLHPFPPPDHLDMRYIHWRGAVSKVFGTRNATSLTPALQWILLSIVCRSTLFHSLIFYLVKLLLYLANTD